MKKYLAAFLVTLAISGFVVRPVFAASSNDILVQQLIRLLIQQVEVLRLQLAELEAKKLDKPAQTPKPKISYRVVCNLSCAITPSGAVSSCQRDTYVLSDNEPRLTSGAVYRECVRQTMTDGFVSASDNLPDLR